MPASTIKALARVSAAVITTAGIALAMTGSASAAPVRPVALSRPANVLVNRPDPAVCVGKTFEVGVWNRSPGGNDGYSLSVYSPAGRRIFYRHGKAPSHWKFWNIRTHRRGVYRTVYKVRPGTKWVTVRFKTRAHHC